MNTMSEKHAWKCCDFFWKNKKSENVHVQYSSLQIALRSDDSPENGEQMRDQEPSIRSVFCESAARLTHASRSLTHDIDENVPHERRIEQLRRPVAAVREQSRL